MLFYLGEGSLEAVAPGGRPISGRRAAPRTYYKSKSTNTGPSAGAYGHASVRRRSSSEPIKFVLGPYSKHKAGHPHSSSPRVQRWRRPVQHVIFPRRVIARPVLFLGVETI